MTTAAPTLRDRKKVRTSAAIFDAAVALMADRSYADITVEEICERAEVGRATFFRSYGSKAGLLGEFARQMAEVAAATLAASSAETAEARLGVIEEVVRDTWLESDAGIREMGAETIRAGMPRGGLDMHAELIALIAEIMRSGQESGEFRTTALTPELLSWMLIVNLGLCVMDWLDHPEGAPLGERTRAALDVQLAGLRQPPKN
ncbi:TetR/AcrR family transcriptional regulator [Nocardioides sp. WS12]|uniref:TetR/AcrR family transcriptional regulator n=1 Tax=Nocardioides sp. WS12 TaxID=2486272 RepID=UPI0015FE1D7F|nr:TetR/AcrR family transcriptional regulator [Nocardioides sp. WS12]